MQIHKLPLPTTPLIFSHFPPFNHSNLQCKLNYDFGFCNSAKRVSLSLTSKRPCGSLVVVKCVDEMGSDKDDSFYMRKCVEVARKAIGCTSPNPMVGCVIVKDGNIVGQGFHPKAGQPHAEVFAIRDAGDLAENATAYVSLEPCNHFGRTPPCTEALIKAKVKKVVVGMVDPNPIVASKGVDRLRGAGIDVVVGVEEQLCKGLNEAYIHRMLTGKPFVTLRYSISMNGQLLEQLGEGVTECGGYYSQLLQEYDAVIFSASLIGNSSLPASQEPGANQPLYIITTKGSSFSLQIPTLTETIASKVIVFTDKEGNVQPETAQKGIESVIMDRISLNAVLEYCKDQGLCSVMLDVRGVSCEFEELLYDAVERNMVQKIIVEVLPVWEESSSVKSLGALKIAGRRLKIDNLQPRTSGQNVVLEGYL